MIWGRIAGVAFGYMFGLIPGAVIGFVIGYLFDRGVSQAGTTFFNPAEILLTQEVFFASTFSIMGFLAKADGRVTVQEIGVAEMAMRQMQLSAERRGRAIEFFRQGKQSQFDLESALEAFAKQCGRHVDLVRIFFEIQVAVAVADGVLHEPERRLLYHMAQTVGFPTDEVNRLIGMITAGRHAHEHPQKNHSQDLQDDYALLGVGAQAGDEEIKKAYRRLMNQHHPDKLAAKGMPKDMLALATEKTQEIKQAYERIKRFRSEQKG